MNFKKMKAYGDSPDDGVVQLNFTLPIEPSDRAREAAIKYVKAMGFKDVLVASMEKAAGNFSCFVVFGSHPKSINFYNVKEVRPKILTLKRKEIEGVISKKVGRPIVIVGATIGSDAHTVGIDAIMNFKGFGGDYGLESYKWIDAKNLGSQVDPDQLVKFVKEVRADVILVSQVVTQKNIHIHKLKEFRKLLKADPKTRNLISVIGGPQIDHKLAKKLGYNAGFGPGTKPSEVASAVLHLFLKKRKETKRRSKK